MFDKLAEEFKQARIKSNLTLNQLAVKTRIDIKFLEAIEEGNFSFLPELYVKAFLKEFANVVGLDADIVLKKYVAAKEGIPYVEEKIEEKIDEPDKTVVAKKTEEKIDENIAENKTPEKTDNNSEKFREVKHSAHQSNSVYTPPPTFDSTTHSKSEMTANNKNNFLMGAVIVGGIIIIGLIYLLFFDSGNEIVVPEKPYDEVISQTQKRYEEAPAVSDSTHNISVSSDSLNLLIQTTDTSWVRLILDNTKVEEFILFPNSQKVIRAANNFKITFGRSSSIKLQLNNKPLAFNPKSKSVSYVKINEKGLEFLQNPPNAGDN
jgi:transcriptional regulator with XRE-family HTH domain